MSAVELAYWWKMKRDVSNLVALQSGIRKLKNKGGRGDENIAFLHGNVVTIRESLTTQIAKEVIEDAMTKHKKKLKELSLFELFETVDLRCRGRIPNPYEVRSEVCRLQNAEIY